MASDIEEDDLEALRCAVLASMKNSVAVKPVTNEDEELAALREAALKTANMVTPPVEPTAVLPPSNPAIKFIGDSKPTDGSPNHPLTNKSGRNLIVIATKEEAPKPAPPSAVVKLLRPQDKFCSDNNSTSSTPTRPKVSNKFDRFESSESDSDSSSSSDSEDEAPIYAIKPEEELLKSDDDLNKLDKVAPDDDRITISVETSKEEDASTDQSLNASLVQAPATGEVSSIALEDIPIPEVETNNVTEKPVRGLCDPTLSDYVSSSSEDETERAKTGSQNSTSNKKDDFTISVSVDKVNDKNKPTDAGSILTVQSKHLVEAPVDKPRSIFQRLGNKSEIVPRTTDAKKDMPIQKSSLLYDIISKKSPGLLMKCKSGGEVEYRSSRLAKEEEDAKGDKAESGRLTERERIILQARKKKFEANKPVEVEKKTLSLKGILRKRSAKKARRNREEGFNQKRDKDIGLSDSEAENRKSDTKRIDKRETDGARKRKSVDAKNDTKIDAKIDAKDNAKNDAILINKRDRYNMKEKHIDSTKVSRHNRTDDDKYKKSSDSKSTGKNATINKSERVVKKGKSSGGKGDGSKPGVPSDSESSDGGDVSWRFHHTGTSSKDNSEPPKKLFERPQEDIEKDKRKRHVELPNDSLDDRTFDQKERRTNMHPFRLAGIRLDGNRYDPDQVNSRPDSRAGGYRRNRSNDRFHTRNDTRRFESFDRFDGRNRENHRFVRDDMPDNHRRKNFVEEDDDDESSKNVTRITSVIKPSKKPCDIPKPRVSSSVSDSSPERRGLEARRSRRTVHVPKSHDKADNAEVQAMTVSLKRKQRKVSSEEQASGIADTEQTAADVSGTKEKSSKSSVHKRLGKSQKVDEEKQPKESKHKKHKKKKAKREVTNDSDTEAQLDAKIRKIQENNAAIIKRRREVIEDRDRYG